MNHEVLGNRRRALEESFFARQDSQLLEQLRSQAAAEELKKQLADVSGIEDAETLFVEVGGGAADVMKNYMQTGELPPLTHNPKFRIENPALAITTAVEANSALLLDAFQAK